MCVGVPMQLASTDGIAGRAVATNELIDLSLTPDAAPGDWVLNFLGAAREVLEADEAAKISAALGGLRALMEGRDLGDAFADLEQTGPRLPTHLQAALDAGETTA
ncbi:HypC/HybG/HupF family hydrogenase formation chaperone [uncultured Roseovarius sp.]|uniref:HypC/HybG/HupF family hydrogenase formation chaperone n=1 Tax=uncultured Roseovarius sp. TaxID=293344 RepID=UPI002619E324|nr:HypC/HybG/HupF family hydrogenase formation chaperone [uncultured Roseovarius sp.]